MLRGEGWDPLKLYNHAILSDCARFKPESNFPLAYVIVFFLYFLVGDLSDRSVAHALEVYISLHVTVCE